MWVAMHKVQLLRRYNGVACTMRTVWWRSGRHAAHVECQLRRKRPPNRHPTSQLLRILLVLVLQMRRRRLFEGLVMLRLLRLRWHMRRLGRLGALTL